MMVLHVFMVNQLYDSYLLQGYFSLSPENRRKLLITLAKGYDLNRTQVRDLIKQYLGLELPSGELSVILSVSQFLPLLLVIQLLF